MLENPIRISRARMSGAQVSGARSVAPSHPPLGAIRALPGARALAVFALLLLAGLCFAQQNRTIQGTVVDSNDNALPKAIVYLKNLKTRAVNTYITGDDGKFSFHALAPNADFQLYAVSNGTRSSTRTVSGFDSRATINLELKVPIAK
jgi:hypothetical protein